MVGSELGGLFFDTELTDSSVFPDATYLLSFSPDFGAVPAFQLTASGAVTDLVAAGTLAVPEPVMPGPGLHCAGPGSVDQAELLLRRDPAVSAGKDAWNYRCDGGAIHRAVISASAIPMS